ncbi:putative ribonuclease H-like domain-containing protein [Tanacetum coccineum]
MYNQLKNKSFEEIHKLYEKEQKWIKDFIPMDSEEGGKKAASNWEVYSEDTRRCWRIIRVGNHTEAYQIFADMLKKFDRDDLQDLKNNRVIDSGCSRHMTGNRSYLTDYEEINGGFVAFGGNENLIDLKVKVIRCDNGTEFKNRVMNQFCEMKGKARMETVPGKDYILLPVWPADPLFSQSSKDSPDVGFKPSGRRKERMRHYLREMKIVRYRQGLMNVDENIVYGCADDLNMPELEDIVYSDDDEDVGAEADMKNLYTFMPVSPILTIRIHKDHPIEQIIRDLNSAPQTRRMTKSVTEHAMFSSVQQRTNHKDFHNYVFACFLSQAKTQEDYPSIKDLKLDQSLWQRSFYKSSYKQLDLDGLLLMAKGPLVLNGLRRTQEDKRVYQMDVKSAFIYGKIEEEVYVCQPPGFEEPNFPNSRGKIYNTLFIRRDKGDILLVQVYVDDIIFGSTKKSLCTEFEKMMHKKFQMSSMGELTFVLGLQVKQKEDGIFISQDNLDRKSTTGGCQFLGCRLISWQCNKQTVVANSTTEAEYIAASNCCGHVLWIQNQLLNYGYNFMQTKIHIDNESIICIVKNHVFHSKIKHIKIRHHFIKDSYEKKLIQMIKIHTDQNVAYLLTKAFDVSRFQYLIASIGMLNL